MKKIAVLTTVFERPELTKIHIKYSAVMKNNLKFNRYCDVMPFYVLSTYDSYLGLFVEEIMRYGLNFVVLPHKSLSTKTQYGLWALQKYEFDYLMHLDSDEFVGNGYMQQVQNQINLGVEWFGSTDEIFLDYQTQKYYHFEGYNRLECVNGGMCVSRELLEKCNWYIWTPGLNRGLNINEHLRYQKAGADLKRQSYGVRAPVEVKSAGEEIHDLNWYREEEYKIRELTQLEIDNVVYNHEWMNEKFIPSLTCRK